MLPCPLAYDDRLTDRRGRVRLLGGIEHALMLRPSTERRRKQGETGMRSACVFMHLVLFMTARRLFN
jgi:hypothetical protein